MAQQPEQLMRARYSAYALGLSDFVIKTYHSSCNAQHDAEQIKVATSLHWIGLEILDAPGVEGAEGIVEFSASYIEDGRLHRLIERSRFVRETIEGELRWRYIDGTHSTTPKPIKLKSNDSCPCHSGAKFKRCCGR